MTGLARGTLAALFALTLVAPVFAQFDPADGARKWRGDYESFHQGTAYHRQAQESSQMIYYSQLVQPAAPVAVIEKQTAWVKDNLTKSDEALKAVKAAHPKDADVAKHVDSILKHHANALTHCNMVAECCKKGDGPDKISACCVEMYDELDAAKKELDVLKKHLKIEDLPVPKKPVPKK